MEWGETVASKCRWAELVAPFFADSEILWEDSDAGYQGFAKVLARLPDGRFAFYEWVYGSCNHCDNWEDEPEEKVIEEIRNGIAYFADESVLARYVFSIVAMRSFRRSSR